MELNTTKKNVSNGIANKMEIIDGYAYMPNILSYQIPYIEKRSTNVLYQCAKRILDILFSIIALFLGFPMMVTIAIIIKFDSVGPVIYKQKRLGMDGRTFTLYKFRSMNTDAEKTGARWAEKNDERVTRIGKIIRKIRFDELPQFINILRGEMSLVGPRPERGIFYDKFEKVIPGFKQRLQVKPGLTGWAQVNGGYELRPDEKIHYDLEYIQNQSLAFDVRCILKTFKIIIKGDG